MGGEPVLAIAGGSIAGVRLVVAPTITGIARLPGQGVNVLLVNAARRPVETLGSLEQWAGDHWADADMIAGYPGHGTPMSEPAVVPPRGRRVVPLLNGDGPLDADARYRVVARAQIEERVGPFHVVRQSVLTLEVTGRELLTRGP